MLPWNLDETRTHVLQCHGETQVVLLDQSLTSLHDRQFFAGYHYHEYRRLLYESVDSKLAESHILELILPLNKQAFVEFNMLQKRVAAHILACVQNLHALGDTLAHAVAYACGLNLGPKRIDEKRISLYSVARRLESEQLSSSLARILHEIETNPEFFYLAALVNHSKHRSIVEPKIHIDATGLESSPYTLRFRSFAYDGQTINQREVETLLEPLYSWLSFQIVDCGNELNNMLAASSSSQ